MNRIDKLVINGIKVGRKFYKKVTQAKDSQRKRIEDFYSKPVLDGQAGNDYISKMLDSSSPIMVARFGATELNCVMNYLQIQRNKEKTRIKKYINSLKGDEIYWNESIRENMSKWSGFFPTTDAMLEKFSIDFLEHTRNIDVLGVWCLDHEDFLYQNYCPKATLIPLQGIEPFFFENPWSANLKDKKVLVVHPYEESIINQFKKREFLFKDKNILTNFDLKVIKAVQSIADNKTDFKNWFEAYDYMCEKISNEDFDISIIGAGAYGLPLASFVKKIGKKAIHMGGATQLMFGIKGKRWDSFENHLKLYNKHWVRPLPSETPQQHKIVEGGAYW